MKNNHKKEAQYSYTCSCCFINTYTHVLLNTNLSLSMLYIFLFHLEKKNEKIRFYKKTAAEEIEEKYRTFIFFSTSISSNIQIIYIHHLS